MGAWLSQVQATDSAVWSAMGLGVAAVGVVTMPFIQSGKWPLFSIHPLGLTAGFLVTGVLGTAIVSSGWAKRAIPRRKNRMLAHGILQALSTVGIIGGTLAIYMNKEAHGKAHMTTLHGIVGYGTVALWAANGALGAGRALSRYIATADNPEEQQSWIFNDKRHRWLGYAAMVGAVGSFGLGVMSNFAVKQMSEPSRVLVALGSLISAGLVLRWK